MIIAIVVIGVLAACFVIFKLLCKRNNLECCGNCIFIMTSDCPQFNDHDKILTSSSWCDGWRSDNMTTNDRRVLDDMQ